MINLETQYLSKEESKEIQRLLIYSQHDPPELEDIWYIMDLVWDELGCDNLNLDQEKISTYYKHPLWTLNGIFIENHDISLQHRDAISSWIVEHKLQSVLDFGGGLGTLARMIANKDPNIQVDIYEPFPSQYAYLKNEDYTNVNFVGTLEQNYDCLVSTDVLEHVSDPLELFTKMIDSVKEEGFLLIANHFYPSIKCHLPSTFHFRYTFNQFAEKMGLEIIGVCEGSHATIYKKTQTKELDWQTLRKLEKRSRFLFTFNEFKQVYIIPWQNRLIKVIKDPIGSYQIIKSKIQDKLS